MKTLLALVGIVLLSGCDQKEATTPATPEPSVAKIQPQQPSAPKSPFLWENANIYFLLTDRFNNGNTSNDLMYNRKNDAAPLRGFMGGDISGITAKVREGYFEKLGIDAIWLTPHVQQIPDSTDEGTGSSYGFHGYWAMDWTAMDANYGTMEEMREFVRTAHQHGIRVLLDVVINHTGPVTPAAPQWPEDWVRTSPACTYKDAPTTVSCTLVANLPDVRTESNEEVELPAHLVAKWKAEGRYDKEVQELNEFFTRTGLPRSPRHHIMKWHLDWIEELGVDGFRVDTVKHTEENVWAEFKKLALETHAEWKRTHPDQKLGDEPFYMVGEVYNYGIQSGQSFDLGGKYVNYFKNGFDSLINFSMKNDAKNDYEAIFSEYSDMLYDGLLAGYSVLHYVSSHDDGQPFDRERKRVFEAGTKLLLSPGAVQVYYGDETARALDAKGEGDASLRSFMNWDELKNNTEKNGYKVADVYEHWSKLGQFRKNNIAVGAGVHELLRNKPYTFMRSYAKDDVTNKVVVALDLPKGEATVVDVNKAFTEGETLKDYYSNQTAIVTNGKVTFNTPYDLVLIGR